MPRVAPWLVLWAAAGLGLAPAAPAAETAAEPSPTGTTLLILKLDTAESLPIQTAMQTTPPILTITFPKQRVVGSLPERSAIAKGVIQTVEARYSAAASGGTRYLDAVRIGLSAPYPSRVRSEAGRIIIEVEHPATVSGTSVEVGVRGGTIIEGSGERNISQRFRAMQEALARVTPTPWSMQFGAPAFDEPSHPDASRHPAASAATPTAHPIAPASAPRHSRRGWIWAWMLLLAAAAAGFRFRGTVVAGIRKMRRLPAPSAAVRQPAGVQLLDELVWNAFARQGYQPVLETEFPQSMAGRLRILVKDGAKTALCFIGNGPFFEKQTVEQFLRAMRTLQAPQGFLVAAGSFTVPAQRVAAEHHVTLIGREELIGLLSAGAGVEHLNRQLAQQQARLDEAQETLRQYAGELDVLRRQRNEASWYLGEERVKSAQLESKVDDLTQKLRQYDGELERREQDAVALRRQWEENEWYLGEARSRLRHIESQLGALQNSAAQLEAAEQTREAATRSLRDEEARRQALEVQLGQLQHHVAALSEREQQLQAMLRGITQKLAILQSFGERRRLPRGPVTEAHVELSNGEEGPLFTGCPRDLSPSGFGLETDRLLPEYRSYRVQLSLPGGERVEGSARLLWQRVEGDGQRVRSGYRILRMPATARDRITELIAPAA